MPGLEVVLEVTGNPVAGVRHAELAIAAGRHVIMVNVEADCLVGPVLAEQARAAKYLPEYVTSTPDTVWDYYGFTPQQLAGGDFNAKMFNSFLDGRPGHRAPAAGGGRRTQPDRDGGSDLQPAP